MPRYYFDFNDGIRSVSDQEGVDALDLDEARVEAITALEELAQEALGSKDQCRLSVLLRDETGTIVFEATITYAHPNRGGQGGDGASGH